MGYYLGGPMKYFYLISPGVTVHTVPYGTDLFPAVFLAVNCQATITWSLRDKNLLTPVHEIESTSPHHKLNRGRRRVRGR
jgi:hypothetical protein